MVLNTGHSQYSVTAYREDGWMNLYLGVSAVSYLLRWRWIRKSMETITSFDPFSQATSLSITSDVVSPLWSPWLFKMHHISRLDLYCPSVTGYLHSLSSSVDGLPLCPSLNTLAFRGSWRSSELEYKSLKSCISFCHAAGCPLTFVLVLGRQWIQAQACDLSWDALIDLQSKLLIIRSI